MNALPPLGLGTFGSDRYGPAQVAEAVRGAAEVGYRHFDCAAVYGNEREVGEALRSCGLSREEYWVTGKLWNDRHDDPEAACEESLRDLGLEYFDLYLIHWPFPNHHGVGVSVDSRDPHAVPFDPGRYLEVWRGLERLRARGLARHIGTSNMTVAKLRAVLPEMAVRPYANEMELHPHFQQTALLEFAKGEGIVPIAYSPLGSPSRPERDRTPEDTVDLQDPVVLGIAARLGLAPAAVILRWLVGLGAVPIPFSVKRPQYEASLRAVEQGPLPADAMAEMSRIDRNCRLIKGQVFLWPDAKDWSDLWDGVP